MVRKMTLRKKQETVRPYDSMRRTTCANCPAGCGLKVFLKDDVIVDIFGDEEHPVNKGSLCPKGMLSYFQLNHPSRLTCARIRENTDQPFRNATWEDALCFIAGRMGLSEGNNPADSLYIFGAETDPFEYLAGAEWFAGLAGSTHTPERFFPFPMGGNGSPARMFGLPGRGLQMNPPRDWCASRCILLYATDPAASDPISFGPIMDAHDRGAILLSIEAKGSVSSSKADLALRVKPGTESKVLAAVLHLVMKLEACDWEFLERYTTGFPAWRALLEHISPEEVSAECWVELAQMEKMAELLAVHRPVQVVAGDWSSRRRLTDDDLSLCGALVCLTGSVGVPGGGLNLLGVSPFLGEPGSSLSTAEPPRSSLRLEPLLSGASGNLRNMICHGDPLGRLSGGDGFQATLAERFIVQLSSFANKTSNFANVILPMNYWLEYEGLEAVGNGRSIQWRNKVIDGPGQCRTPLDFWTDLASTLRLVDVLPWANMDGSLDRRTAADHFMHQNPLTRMASVELLDPETNPPGGLLWPCTEEADLGFEDSRLVKGNVRGRNILFQYRHNYPTTGKRFPNANDLVVFPLLDQGDHSTHTSRESFEEAPLFMITGVLVDYVENLGFLVSDKKNEAPRGMIKIHPQLGKVLGVATGDNITLANRHGHLTGPAWLSDEVDPRVVWCAEGLTDPSPGSVGGPRALFPVPAENSPEGAFTRVTAYRDEQRGESRQALLAFLSRLHR